MPPLRGLISAVRGHFLNTDVSSITDASSNTTFFGVLVGLLMVGMKVVPLIPGHFSLSEWIALAGWCVLGLILSRGGRRQRAAV